MEKGIVHELENGARISICIDGKVVYESVNGSRLLIEDVNGKIDRVEGEIPYGLSYPKFGSRVRIKSMEELLSLTMEELLATSVKFVFDPATTEIFLREGINTLAELVSRTFEEVKQIYGMGKNRQENIIQVVDLLKLKFAISQSEEDFQENGSQELVKLTIKLKVTDDIRKIIDAPIDSLNLSPGVNDVFVSYRVWTNFKKGMRIIRDLIQLTETQLRDFWKMGDKGIEEINRRLADLGLSLGTELEE